MPNKLYITKVLPDGYGVGVIPELEMPFKPHYYDEPHPYWQAMQAFKNHLASLPTFLLHPSFNPKEGEWIEQWREGWEVKVFLHPETVWEECNEETYSFTPDLSRRIVLLPLVEKKIEIIGYSREQTPEGNTPASEGIKKDDKLINHIRNIKLLQAIHEGKKFYVECYSNDDDAKQFPNTNFAVKEIELPNFDLFEEKMGYKWLQSPPSLQEREKGMFNEDKLRKEIANKWGEYGAHIEVFDLIVNQNKIMKEELQRLSGKYGYELPFPPNESDDTAKQSK